MAHRDASENEPSLAERALLTALEGMRGLTASERASLEGLLRAQLERCPPLATELERLLAAAKPGLHETVDVGIAAFLAAPAPPPPPMPPPATIQ